jgi:sortase (surface protein transpeptidase)
MSNRLSMTGRRGVLTLLALTAVVAGLVLVVVAVLGQQTAPRPPRAVGRIETPSPTASAVPSSSPSQAPSQAPSTAASDGPTSTPLGPSRPVRIRIPAIGVDSKVTRLGLADDGTLAVPQPGPDLNHAAWFENSPTPGQPGPSIIEGHVDSEQGPSVFFRLGDVRPGDRIRVTRKDGVTLVFTVNAVRDFKKKSFPTSVVYGGDLSTPQLRLITCSDFDRAIRHHVGNEVVFAHLTRTRNQGQ